MISALVFLAGWMLGNRNVGFDKYPFILLNLILLCLAALQGAILLIAAKREDQIGSELAEHDNPINLEADRIVKEAARRLDDPPEVSSLPVLIVGVLGLAVNLVAFMLLRQGATESLNVKGAYFEVVADTLGSIGVIAAALMWVTGWGWVDPVIGAGIGLFILPRAWRLGRDALRILVQAVPDGADLGAITEALTGIDGVVDVHDLHVWTLTSDMEVLTAHLGTSTDADPPYGAP